LHSCGADAKHHGMFPLICIKFFHTR
jgi:hypothetical protein